MTQIKNKKLTGNLKSGFNNQQVTKILMIIKI